MAYQLRVDPVESASRLPDSLSPGQADDYGDYDDGVLTVDREATAAELAEYPNVERLDGDATPEVGPEETGSQNVDIDAQVDAGVCPWCDDYEGDYLGQHASSAHPDAWDAYNE